jgi:hypothetical protein
MRIAIGARASVPDEREADDAIECNPDSEASVSSSSAGRAAPRPRAATVHGFASAPFGLARDWTAWHVRLLTLAGGSRAIDGEELPHAANAVAVPVVDRALSEAVA